MYLEQRNKLCYTDVGRAFVLVPPYRMAHSGSNNVY